MINWFNMPDEGLSNGGLFEVKELEVTENGTYEEKGEMNNKVTVNVSGGGGDLYSLATNILQIAPSGEKNLTWIEENGYYIISFKWYTPTFDINTIEPYYRNINIKVGESQLSAEYVPLNGTEPLTIGNYMIMLYFADGDAYMDIATRTAPSESAVTVKYGETDVYTWSNDLKTLFPNKNF